MSTDMQERVDRLNTMIAEDRIIRERWTDGHERACLLAALSPEAGRFEYASACPAHVMPAWLAYMTPWIDDEASDEAWPRVIRRYAALARRWSVLDDDAWERARIASLIAIVSEARLYCPPAEVRVLAAIDGVLAWLRRGAPESERATRAAASWAVRKATSAAASWAGARAAESASWAASWAAAESAASASKAASWAGAGAESAWAAESAASAARAAASDSIATAVLDAIEAEIESAYGEEEP